MLKSYNEMRKIDVSPYCEMRKEGGKELTYLNWAKCVDLLHENGAEKVSFIPLAGSDGSSLIKTDMVFTDKDGKTNRVYETRIKVEIDDLKFEFQGPVMNGANPVKDNSMSQQRLWNCQARMFVKAVAIHTGLGFDLWLKNEEAETTAQKADDIYHDIRKVKERFQQILTAIQKEGSLSLSEVAERMKRTEDELKNWMSQYDILFAVENNLEYILRQVRQERNDQG